MIQINSLKNIHGFTLIELIMIITIVGILAISIAVKWPTGLEEEAAAKEFIHAFRYAQHQAMTRQYSGPANAWGMFISGGYTIRQNDTTNPINNYTNRSLLDDSSITLAGPDVIFNGLGEPMTTAGVLHVDGDGLLRSYTIAGIKTMTFCAETGFIQAGAACP